MSEDGNVSSDWARRSRAGDFVLIACAIIVILVTWATLSRANVGPIWKPCGGVAAIMLLTLAALTPRDDWAITIRRVIGGWLIAAPWILGFADVSAARWSYVIGGALIAALSMARPPRRQSMIVALAPGDALGGSSYGSVHP